MSATQDPNKHDTNTGAGVLSTLPDVHNRRPYSLDQSSKLDKPIRSYKIVENSIHLISLIRDTPFKFISTGNAFL